MVASTALMGGMVAWITGDDFLQGAMRGMTIGIFNHSMHDSNNVIAYSHDQNGNISGEISEVVVSSSRYTSCALIDVVANLNTFIDGAGASMKKMEETQRSEVTIVYIGIPQTNEDFMAISM